MRSILCFLIVLMAAAIGVAAETSFRCICGFAPLHSTGMSKMFRACRPDIVMGDFVSRQTIADRARPVLQDGRRFIEIREGTHRVGIDMRSIT